MIRETRQLRAIRRALESTGRPLAPSELLEEARRDAPTLGLATVYRTIARLCEAGEVVAVELPGAPPRYELRRADDGHDHHHHFHCDRCGRVFDVEGCPRGIDRIAPEGFSVRGHEVVLYGSCADCGDAP